MTAILLGLGSFDAAAQWYVFPGFRKKQKADTTSVTGQIPVPDIPVSDTFRIPVPDPDLFIFEELETVNLTLSLPFKSRNATNSGMMDFYCGALIAAREAGLSGTKINFGTYDISPSGSVMTGWSLNNSDIIIGPPSPEELLKEYARVGDTTKFIISALDPQASELTGNGRFIQVPVSNEMQVEDMLNWLESDLNPSDRVVVVLESNAGSCPTADLMLAGLDAREITYTTISYGILQGLQIFSEFAGKLAPSGGTTRYLIASESESFIGDAVRNVGVMKHKGHDIALYGTSRMRSYSSIEAELLHEIGLKDVTSYYVDYDAPEVKSFVLAYRTLFNAEPGAFAFSGYDVAGYFLSISAKYGKNWVKKLEDYGFEGLQADFRFSGEGKGFVNKATRRIIYNPDFTISISR